MADAITTAVAYVVTIGVLLLWVFLSKQKRVPRTLRTAVGISLRTLPFFLVLLLACQGLGVDVRVAVAVLGVVLWVFLTRGGSIVILYVIQQWILGWPDREEFLLEPPSPSKDLASRLDELSGQTGVAVSALRPAGTVAVDRTEYPAHSDLGYIDRGTAVRVVGRKGPSLIVRIDTMSGVLPAERDADLGMR